jgi:hypothetical protein
MVALGSRPHFDRPNLPVAPGYHPAQVQVALAPFDLDALQHFIFLERPAAAADEDSASYASEGRQRRGAEIGALMPSAPDYETIGEFYDLLSQGMQSLAAEIGEAALFIGPADSQLRAEDIGIEELSVVTDLRSATRALHLIVVQGEGSPAEISTSHYEQFKKIQTEYLDIAGSRQSFVPSRAVVRNPVMRLPMARGRVHITGRAAAPILDAANAVYSLMLRCLVAVYDTPGARTGPRKALLSCATGLMKALARLSSVLTTLPATDDDDRSKAGVSFAMLRSTEGFAPGVDPALVLEERFSHIVGYLPDLHLPEVDCVDLLSLMCALQKGLSETRSA